MINVTGYLAEEKMEIANHFLLPKQLQEHGMDKKTLRIDPAGTPGEDIRLDKTLEELQKEARR